MNMVDTKTESIYNDIMDNIDQLKEAFRTELQEFIYDNVNETNSVYITYDNGFIVVVDGKYESFLTSKLVKQYATSEFLEFIGYMTVNYKEGKFS